MVNDECCVELCINYYILTIIHLYTDYYTLIINH